jgi:hypothetical protein
VGHPFCILCGQLKGSAIRPHPCVSNDAEEFRLFRDGVGLMPKAAILLVGLHHVYQYKEGLAPSREEKAQRAKFTARMKSLIDSFQPTVIADESPDTANADLLALYPANAVTACVDIPFSVKLRANLMVSRPEDGSLCPYVDDLREKVWERGIRRAMAGQQNPRVLMLCGAQHLYSFPLRQSSFIQRLQSRGYNVTWFDLRNESWWDASWEKDWIDPDPKPSCTPRPCCVWLEVDSRHCGLGPRYRTEGRRTQIRANKIRSADQT